MPRKPKKPARKPTEPVVPSKPAVPAAITPPMPAGFVWGALEIGKVIGRSERQAHHLIYTGKLKSVRKVGSQWCANVAALLAELGGESGEVRS